jgi:hypothetical protein
LLAEAARWVRPVPQAPIKTVAEQIALLRAG